MTQPSQKRIREHAKHSQKKVRSQDTSEAQKDRTEALKGDLDEVLDEIDEVLESNAEEFVKQYVQKGGE